MRNREEREIVRRLSERGEAEPPPGLLDRIRAEIPAEVRVGGEIAGGDRGAAGRLPSRHRWLVAASLAAMVGAGLFSLHVYQAAEDKISPSRMAETVSGSTATQPEPRRMPEVPPAPRPVSPAAGVAAPLALPALPKVSPDRRQPQVDAGPPRADKLEQGVAGGVAGGSPGAPPPAPPPPSASSVPSAPAAPATTGAIRNEPEESRPAGSPAAAAPPANDERAPGALDVAAESPEPSATAKAAPSERRVLSKPSREVAMEATAADLPVSVFSPRLRIGSDDRLRRALESAPLSTLKEIPVESLVDIFGEERMAPAAEGARLSASGTAASGGDNRRRLLFRLRGAALSPAARFEVKFDPAAVVSYRRVSAGELVLYEVELRPGAPSTAVVATLRWVSGSTAAPSQILRMADLDPVWERASPGFRRASLAADLAEALRGSRSRSELPDLLRQARALAAELPGDASAARLVRLAERASP